MKRFLILTLLAPGLALASTTDTAQALQQTDMSLSLAKRLADSAQRTCAGLGKSVAITVVDRAGQIVVMQRGDDVGPHNVEASRRKAYTAVSTRTSTLEFARRVARSPDTAALAAMPELLLIGGGVPVRMDGTVVGAVGVAGGGGPENDNRCAAAGGLGHPGLDPG